MIQSGGFRALPDQRGCCGVVESRPTGVWAGPSGGLWDSEELGLSGLGLIDMFVSQPAVGASSLFTRSKVVTLLNG